MAKRALDLPRLLSARYRDKTIDTFIENTIEPQLSRDDTQLLYGFAGSDSERTINDIYLTEPSLERKLNQLQAAYDVTLGTERSTLVWSDFLQRLVTLGLNPAIIDSWLTLPAHKLAPPISIDKLINYEEYVWIGPWLIAESALPYHTLGIAPVADVTSAAAISNNDALDPEYYTISRGALDGGFNQVAPYPAVATWPAWSVMNLWVHKEDAYAFVLANPTVSVSSLSTASRPIVELDINLQLNAYVDANNDPAESGTSVPQVKTSKNQPPQFDLFYHDGTHAKLTSMLFFFEENQQNTVDPVIGRRIVRDSNADLSFSHGFIEPSTKRLLWAKLYNGASFDLKTIWSSGTEAITPVYSRYDQIGTVLNLDKFTNWRNYYWIGPTIDSGSLPAWNPVGLAEYTVLEVGDANGWSAHNYWKHASELEYNSLPLYHRATKPIIEFNSALSTELVAAKTTFNQAPKFNVYLLNATTDTYDLVPAIADPLANDTFTSGLLLARFDDLTQEQQLVIDSTSEVSDRLTFTNSNERFVSTFASGEFAIQSGPTFYGFNPRLLYTDPANVGTGAITIAADATALPQTITLVATSPTAFSVTSSLGGLMAPATVSIPYILNYSGASDVTFTIEPDIAFVAGDRFILEVKSILFEHRNFYAKLGSTYRTFATSSGIISDTTTTLKVAGNPLSNDGAWEVPEPVKINIDNETRLVFSEGDLITHFADMLGAQPGFIGFTLGSNNSRILAFDDSLGGTIKQFEQRIQLLLGLLAQRGFTARDLLDFSSKSYEQLLNSLREFVEVELVSQLETTPVMGGLTTLDQATIDAAISYVERRQTSSLEADRPFALTTMPIKALALTMPYLGLLPAVQPAEELDLELNIMSLTHHDGHRSPLATVDENVLKRIVLRQVLRSNGQTTPGFIGGPIPPLKPFAKQLWLDLSTMVLNIFDVVTDVGDLPLTANIGQFAYDRTTGEVWEWNGSWTSIGATLVTQQVPWRPIDLSKTLQGLLLAVEEILYQNVPPIGPFLTANATGTVFDASMQQEFEQFAAIQSLDPYAVNYDASNPFTWSYKGAFYPGTTNPPTWQQLYLEVYGTPRPDLQPWVSSGFVSEAAFLTAAAVGGYLPFLTPAFIPATMWSAVGLAGWISGLQIGLGKPAELSVDVVTGTLLPPFAFGASEQLLAAIPPTLQLAYQFGENGPVELIWKRSTAFCSAYQHSVFRVNPLEFISTCWGESIVTVANYSLLDKIGAKPSIACQLHGELEEARTLSATATLVSAPLSTTSYVFEVVASTVLKVTVGNVISFTAIAATYTDSVLNFTASVPVRGLNLGDKFLVDVTPLGEITVTAVPIAYKLLSGYGQLFSQLVKTLGADDALDTSAQLLRGWRSSFVYNTGKIIDSSLNLEANRASIAKESYTMILKERFLAAVSWYSALSITLLRVGSTEHRGIVNIPAQGLTGQRGDDWVFLIETYVPGRPKLEWYQPSSERTTFFALNAARSQDEWTRPKSDVTLLTTTTPAVLTGIQAVVDFISGVASRYAEQGYLVDGQAEIPADSTTGRPRDWQLLLESFVDQQFSGIQAGSTFLFDPLSSSMFFSPTDGMLTKIVPTRSATSVYSVLFDKRGRPINSPRVFRTNNLTTIISDEPIYSARLTTSQFEHTIVLDDRSDQSAINHLSVSQNRHLLGSLLIYDSFLGISINRLFLTGRYSFNAWKPESGSRFLSNNVFLPNIEGTVQNLSKLYDSGVEVLDDPARQRARALLGYSSKDYYQARNAPELTQFRFWQGAIKAKGTNRAINAFVNSKQYQTASIDEYWAYKVASYGDVRQNLDVELKVEPTDNFAERTNYLFLETDDLSPSAYVLNITNGSYDVLPLDEAPLDFTTTQIYEGTSLVEMTDLQTAIAIGPNDESRWFRYDELGSMQYIDADLVATVLLTPDRIDRCYSIIDPKTGKPVIADCFELVDTTLLIGSDAYDVLPYDSVPFGDEAGAVYHEVGELLTSTSPVQYTTPKFRRLNHCTIKLDDPTLIGRSLRVLCYAPALKKYSPSALLTYTKAVDEEISDEIIWWDPARGSHSPQAHALVNISSDLDPAIYNQALIRERSTDQLRAWGPNQVGKVWWDTHLSEWLPYADTKIRPSFYAREAAWGALKDFGEIALYEWIESDVPPLEYDSTSITSKAESSVGFIKKIFRSRSWEIRPIAWLKSADPQSSLWAPLKLGTTDLVLSNNLLYAPSGVIPQFKKGEKLATALFNSLEKELITLSSVSGVVIIRSAQQLIVGSSTAPQAPSFPSTDVTTSQQVKLRVNAFKLANDTPTSIVLTVELDGSTPYLRITLGDLKTQRLTLDDIPPDPLTLIELNFDQLGLSLTAIVNLGRADSWPIFGIGTNLQRVEAVFTELALADIVVRNVYETETLISLPSNTLPSLISAESTSWISWIDPTAFELSNDNPSPFNKWKLLAGDWSSLSGLSTTNIAEIKARYEAPWSVQPYRSAWGAWQEAKPQLLRTTYCTFGQTPTQAFEALQFVALEQQAVLARAYINGIYHKIGPGTGITLVSLQTGYYDVTSFDTDTYSTTSSIPTWYLEFDVDLLNQGDEIVVIVPPIVPTAAQLALDLSTAAADPTIATEWKLDAPHVAIERRSLTGSTGKISYYFWVRNKQTPPARRNLSISSAEQLLRAHDSFYAVPQILKFYNQADGRPNRYALLSVRGLLWNVVLKQRYKLRIKRISAMRDDDTDITLKPIYTEWKLIRQNQPNKIPLELWTVLTNTLCGESPAGQELPALVYSDYDARENIIPASWGFELPRVMCPVGVARDTVKNTILSPTTTKYNLTTQSLVINPLQYSGFDVAMIDTYLSSPTSIREFMELVWSRADPKQINELFFSVLQDSLAYTRELPGIFKTSYIAVDNVRTSNILQDAIL